MAGASSVAGKSTTKENTVTDTKKTTKAEPKAEPVTLSDTYIQRPGFSRSDVLSDIGRDLDFQEGNSDSTLTEVTIKSVTVAPREDQDPEATQIGFEVTAIFTPAEPAADTAS